MPYSIRYNKETDKYEIVKESTGEIVGHSDTHEMAFKSVRARYAYESKKNKK